MTSEAPSVIASKTNGKPELSILFPVRDETVNIPIVMKLLKALVETPHEVLIIYDKEDDESAAATRAIQDQYPYLRLVYNDLGRGVVNAIRKGVQESRAPYVLVSCVDDVGPLMAMDDMVALLREGCDFVSGTRYAYGGRRLGGSFLGKALSTGANTILRLCGSVLTDATTGLKMFKREAFDRLHLESRPIGWVVAFELGIKAQLVGFKLGEVPLLSVDRLYGGESTFALGPWFVEYLRWLFWGILEINKKRFSMRRDVTVRIPSATATNKALDLSR
jgi:glycosyltransferase involved in cell wall biosynthesis